MGIKTESELSSPLSLIRMVALPPILFTLSHYEHYLLLLTVYPSTVPKIQIGRKFPCVGGLNALVV
jgi:hypothetical protein